MTIKYFTKDTLIEAAKAGNDRGYNRQLDPDQLEDLQYENFLPITLTLPHEHILGELVEPHVRAMVQVGPEEKVLLDLSWERYHGLPEFDEKALATVNLTDEHVDGQHRTSQEN